VITQDIVKANLHYDPDTGVFTRIAGRRNYVGKIAGSTDALGYIIIRIHNRRYKAHRLAIIYMEGSINDDDQVDHINGVKNDNRYCNLRLATSRQNCCNRETYGGVSKYKGVNFVRRIKTKRGKPWRASICCSDGTRKFSVFHTEKEAALQYNEWAKELHGEYAVLNEVDETDVC
jgi:hypothetical protein